MISYFAKKMDKYSIFCYFNVLFYLNYEVFNLILTI